MPRRARNDRLRALLTAAEWSYDNLARTVNIAGAEAGLRLRYDRTAVAHWLTGSRPRAQVPMLIAEVLSRRLGRPVTLTELGFEVTMAEEKVVRPASALTVLTDLVKADLSVVGRGRLARSVYRLDVLEIPMWPERAVEVHCHRRPARQTSGTVGMAQHMVRVFAAANHKFGSGHARTALTTYLADDILPSLAAENSDADHRELLGAVLDLTLLLGFSCFDSNEHGLGQRYYRIALDLAVLTSDPVRYAIVLRALSLQAYHLGHGTAALGLALTALTVGDRHVEPHTSAFLHAQVSLSYALLGRSEAALAAHHRARENLRRATEERPVFGSYNRGELSYHAASIRVFDGDTAGAVTALHRALRHYPSGECRSLALTLAELAERQLDLGLLSRACTVAHRFLDVYPGLRSGRVTTALGNLRKRLQSFGRHPDAQALVQRCAALPSPRPR
ncbi:hypothetical protein SAMN04489729_1533 [Amycolatopsis lurida]|uniref:Transcriptional regulator n=1 Tax=Amycolatopsis lurida NRRL 2430 TaxID=1460371 RepID=A0A2P2FZ72_AMYLU|nr:hypothetical protein [Amycolatopsis lurida]KFU82022.1 hypothetical protein BB31_06680 [Amycolatopsis lurida NRRL 2430]SEC42216.1 hypothetical protein SAMN04489729_1533 [Amycolatopsis lurida]